jgi:hypothetical protein
VKIAVITTPIKATIGVQALAIAEFGTVFDGMDRIAISLTGDVLVARRPEEFLLTSSIYLIY